MVDSELPILDGKVYHLRLSRDQLADNIILVGDPHRADKVASFFESIDHKVQNREFTTRTGTYRDTPISVIGTGIGTDNTEIALVELFALKSFDDEGNFLGDARPRLNLIRVGTCGTPQSDIPLGTMAISDYAVGLDSTALYYQSEEQGETSSAILDQVRKVLADQPAYCAQATPELAQALTDATQRNARGITVSCPGFFAPQGRQIEGLPLSVPGLQEKLAAVAVDKLRIINLEMETSLLFHLAGIMGYRCASICTVVANRPLGTFLEDYSAGVDRAIKGALDVLADN